MRKDDCRDYRDRLVALAENPLGPEAEPGLIAHLEACADCEAEYHWIKSLCGELESMGDALADSAPEIDLTDSVMKALARHKQAQAQARPQLVVLEPVRSRRFSRFAWIAASAAAAAMIVAGLWIGGYRITSPYSPNVAVQAPGSSVPQPHAGDPNGQLAEVRPADTGVESDNPLQDLINKMRPYSAPPADVSPGQLASLSADEVLAARKEAINDPAARAQLNRWANLAAEKARELVAAKEASLAAKVGAAQSLPPEEAERILLAAVQADPDNPYLHYALGGIYSQQAGMGDKAAAEYEAQAALDPENSLPYYELAASMLQQGDTEGAAGALEMARSLADAHPYTQESAEYQEQALVQSGLAEDVARILTALTAGTSQYGDLVALSSQLLDYGKYYEQSGQSDLAQQIYDSVRIFGTQLVQSAVFSNEQLAGLDIQHSAIEILSEFVQYMDSPENAQLLANQTHQLSTNLNSVGNFFTSLNSFFDGQPNTDVMRLFSDYVLGNGDLNVLDFLANQQH